VRNCRRYCNTLNATILLKQDGITPGGTGFAKIQKKPLWKALNVQQQNVVMGADIPLQDSLDKLLALISEAQRRDFNRIKLWI